MSSPVSNSSKFTAEQDLAIRTRHVSVALSAGAGCGKTFVLTERFLAYFDPADPQALSPAQLNRLVAITFTDRAAREMRDRVRRKCFERLGSADESDADYWLALARSLDSARISTIHSFCASLLRAHAVEARLDPRFRVLEQAQADTLLAECIDDALRGLLSQADERALDLVVLLGLERLREIAARLVARRDDQFATWLERTPEELLECWQQHHKTQVIPALLHTLATLPATETLLATIRNSHPTHRLMQERCRVLVEKMSAWQTSPSAQQSPLADLELVRASAMVQGGGGKSCWDNEEAYERFRDAAKKLRDKIDELADHLKFDPSAALPAAVAGLQVLSLASEIAQRFDEEKQRLGVLDFHDLLSRACRLLSAPEHEQLRKRLGAQIQLLLVDECQDTDPVQVKVVSALCGDGLAKGKLFSVGDLKQSIYRFRGADPHVFREMRHRTPPEGRLPLTLNFRSQPAILTFVNALFHDELGPDYEPLRPHRKQVTQTPSVEFLWAEVPDAGTAKEPLRKLEADWIARRLRAMFDGRERLVCVAGPDGTSQPRPVEPGDVALLLRALSDVEHYEEALERYGIDYYLVGGHAFYAQQEIFDLLNLLRGVDCPADSVSLAGVLRSPFFSLADETLFWLAQHKDGLPGGLFADGCPGVEDPQQRQRARFAAATLRSLHQQKDRVGIAELINQALALTGYDAVLLGEFLGERKLANLRKLVDQARSFDRSGLFALPDFIAQLSGFVAKQPDEPLAATQPEATNVVRLMSIHQSKGLEFPVVVIPDLDRAMHGQNPPVAFDAQWGPLVRMPQQPDGANVIGGHDLYCFLESQEEQQELKRLLYVAMTRAADYLILSSGVPKLGSAGGPWMRLIDKHFDVLTGKPRLAQPHNEPTPEIKVTTTRPETSGSPNRRATKDLAAIVRRSIELPNGEVRVAPLIGPIAPDLAARRQYSFSRLFGTLYRTAPAAAIQADDDGEQTEPSVDPRGLGTLVHAVLAQMDHRTPVDLKAICERSAEQHLVTAEETQQAFTIVERFLQCRRAKDLANCDDSLAELEFMLGWPPEGDSRGVYLSGYIDRLYRDRNGLWHLLDFKTGRVESGQVAKAAAAYEMQMLVYALAVETIVGQPPASVVLHFLQTGVEHVFTWDARSRRRVIAKVDAAIAAAN